MNQINVGIVGFGTVGTGVLRILTGNRSEIERKIGSAIEVTRIADLDIIRPRRVRFDRNILTTDVSQVLDDPAIDIVVETIGGVHPAKEFILRALANGKHVVSANKELIAKEGSELLRTADKKGLDFYFEGSVGGGIPIIRPLKESLAANKITEVMGIVNGTTNYILTKMALEGRDFAKVLAEAQKAGYAEPDPTSDIEGYDAKYKIAILASIAFTSRVNVDDIYCEGITKIGPRDIKNADELGYTIKLLAIAKRNGDKMQIRVHPTLIPSTHPLASVNDVYNAIYVRGDFVQDVMFYGRGAGSLPTGSALAGDIMEIARNMKFKANGRLPCTCFDQRAVESMDEVVTKYYIRMLVADRPGVLAKIAGVFGKNGVSIASVVQKDQHGGNAEIVMVTHQVAEKNFRRAIGSISNLNIVAEISNWIRVEE
ncbi:MAG TPA: homoserine dehydrogenase [Armatimonadota bacterium]|nr:homoserine dehydrogenase [Armatimonadota bacterium]